MKEAFQAMAGALFCSLAVLVAWWGVSYFIDVAWMAVFLGTFIGLMVLSWLGSIVPDKQKDSK